MNPINKNKLALVLLAILLLAGVLVVLEKTKTTDFIKLPTKNTPSQTSPTAKEKKEQSKNEAVDKQSFLDEEASMTPPEQTSTTSPTTVTLTLSATQESGNVIVLTKLKDVSAGACSLTASNGLKETSQSAQVIYGPEFSSCAGFSVPVDSVGIGVWEIQLSVTPSGSNTVSKIMTLEVR